MNSQSVFSRALLPWLPRARPNLVLLSLFWFDSVLYHLYRRKCWNLDVSQPYGTSRPVTGIALLFTTYIISRLTIQNTSVVQQWIYTNHIENTSSSIVAFTARCIITEVIRLLPAYCGCCLAIDVLLFRAFASAGMCLPTRCLAISIRVAILLYSVESNVRKAINNELEIKWTI
jgi:hypothetical protein